MAFIFADDRGSGKTVVLLHGFLENHTVWSKFSEALSHNYRVLSFDLPGFGKSDLPDKGNFSISDVAEAIIRELKGMGVEAASVIGHSLGGYVALAMVEKEPKLLSSFGLFHSTALADSPEKKEARIKTIDFVKRNGALAFTSNFIPPLFADQQHPAIPFVEEIAKQTKEKTVVRYLYAMRDRPDRTAILKKFEGPILFLAGTADTIIPIVSIENQAKTAQKPHFLPLNGVGHMGMFEAFPLTLEIVNQFLKESGSIQ
jgi:pimeloyl-ACP methyl ester carboxylesterase